MHSVRYWLEDAALWLTSESKYLHRGGGLKELSFVLKVLLSALIILACIALLKIFNILRSNFTSKTTKEKLGRRAVHKIHDKNRLLKEIHYAAAYCSEEPRLVERCIALLTRHPAAVNLTLPGGGYTPFMRACFSGCADLISYMLKNGADVKAKDLSKGDDPFYLVAHSIAIGKCDTFQPLKQLIAAGADVNGRRAGGYTALHAAAARGDGRLVCWLLSHGADVAPSSSRHTPFHVAVERGHFSTAALLQVTTDMEHTCGQDKNETQLIKYC